MDDKLKVKKFGLIGKDIGYSFSRNYFENKFSANEEFSNLTYENFDIDSISKIQEIFKIDNLVGLNVTIPYKKEVIPYLDELSDTAKIIGAVNTICFKNDIKIGHNTDVIGFKKALKNILSKKPEKAIILGTGGASRAIEYVLKSQGIDIRQPGCFSQFHMLGSDKTVFLYFSFLLSLCLLSIYVNVSFFHNY